jgi:lipopolysaccharide transport system ATP-binding protein
MAFQNKCLSKMREAATKEGRTVLYVSHNMNTIRQLCDRVIVLEKGSIVYDGEVEDGINVYLSNAEAEKTNRINLTDKERTTVSNGSVRMEKLSLPMNEDCVYICGEKIRLDLTFTANKEINGAKLGVTPSYKGDIPVGTSFSSELGAFFAGESKELSFEFDTSCLSEGAYSLSLSVLQCDDAGNAVVCDRVDRACTIEMKKNEDERRMNWEYRSFGAASLPVLKQL